LHLIDEDRAPVAYRAGSDRAFPVRKPDPDETLCQLAIRLLSNQFVVRLSPPEVNSADLKELAGGAAEELDQRVSVGAFRSLGGNPQQQFLKSLVRTGQGASFLRRRRIAFDDLQNFTPGQSRIFVIPPSD
jgi:hypothetical protein